MFGRVGCVIEGDFAFYIFQFAPSRAWVVREEEEGKEGEEEEEEVSSFPASS